LIQGAFFAGFNYHISSLNSFAVDALKPVVDYFSAIWSNSTNNNWHVNNDAERTLESAAAKGNMNAEASLDKFNAWHSGQ
jgi:hypothetical protein